MSIQEHARAWTPSLTLGLDVPSLAASLENAISTKSDWLWHPCVSRLTMGVEVDACQRDLQLAVWVAGHVNAELGAVTVPTEISVWVPDGPISVQRGRFPLREVATQPIEQPNPGEPALDIWCESLGYAEPLTWAATPPTQASEVDQLMRETERYLRSVAFLKAQLPACHRWIADVTRVTVPLRGEGATFRSCSHPGLPGVVELDLLAEHQILEALVHESAHLYLYRAEAVAPLVDPSYHGRHQSPLRPEPRPLRGILLAFHALAYIAAFYRDTLDVPVVAQWGRSELSDRIDQAREAEATLLEQSCHLKPAGRAFLNTTRQVLEYSAR